MASIDIEGLCARARIDPSLVRDANAAMPAAKGGYVLLWMQRAQRAYDNPALDFAVECANALDLPLLVVFALAEYPSATIHHYTFMLAGLRETARALRERGIAFCVKRGDPEAIVRDFGKDAAVIIGDEGRTIPELAWRQRVLADASLPKRIFVETDAVVPPELACPKLAWSAAQLRNRISAFLPHFLEGLESPHTPRRTDAALNQRSVDTLLESPAIQPGSARSEHPLLKLQRIEFTPGYSSGMGLFRHFLDERLSRYAEFRNDPNSATQSDMSPYLHFGQVSARRLAREALLQHPARAQAYIEELVVRRELAINFVTYCPNYPRYESAVPSWAKDSLAATARDNMFSKLALESATTDDPYWNAAQLEMILTGKMHNYMRMYWGKKILSWFRDPHEAYSFAIEMNDRYSLDGRDPNGYAGVAWCFGRHDRPWPHREGFGNVRSMTSEGLRRKFDADLYAERMRKVYNARIPEVS